LDAIVRTAVFLLLGVAVGCEISPASPKPVSVPLSEVSREVIDVAQEAVPTVRFESVRKIQVDGEDVLEIRGKQPNGKVREVEISLPKKEIKAIR
jgi:hypothetical protein